MRDLILPFAGGLGMFIYGMQKMARGMERMAGGRMQRTLERVTKNRILGVLLGAIITAVIQSSSATTVMVVGLVGAGMLNLSQAMCVIMGANIGTTVTGWLVSSGEWSSMLTPDVLAPISIFLGVFILLFVRERHWQNAAEILVGFGLLFWGISTMSDAVTPLRESKQMHDLFVELGTHPFSGILAGALVTAIIQSSSASVGILQSLAAVELVPFQSAVYIIMGQNIGTCVTALLSSIGAKKNAKTAALMHLLFNLIGTVVFSTVSILFFVIKKPTWGMGTITQTQIGLVHTVFNVGTTILLLPFANRIVNVAKRICSIPQ